MGIVSAVVGFFWAALCCPEIYCIGAERPAVCVQIQDQDTLICELPIIRIAANRNNCKGDKFSLLLAVRKSENGRPGREFGILDPEALARIDREPKRSLDIQAGWAAATIIKNHQRWKNAGRPGDFIDYLADRYVPKEADPVGNQNWKRNVRYWFNKFKGVNNGKENRANLSKGHR